MTLDGTAPKSAEFVTESTFGTFPANPTLLGFGGYTNPVKIKKKIITDKFAYLKGSAGTNRLQSTKTQKTSEAFEASVEIRPTSWSILPYVLCAPSATTYAIGDTVYDVALGVRLGNQYEKLVGGCFNKYEISMEPEKAAVATLSGMFAGRGAFSATDYIGSGSRAPDPTGDALKFEDLKNVVYDSAAFSTNNASLESLKFGIEYSAKPIKDISSTLPSKIGAWAYGQRNISLELGLTLDDVDMAADMLGGSAHTFAFTGLSKTFTYSNIIWEGDWEENLDADDIVGMTLKATNVDLAIA